MKCPFCSYLQDKVVDSRESKEADSIRRRRECERCGKRFTTYERIDEIPYMVIKKDGSRQKFDRQKVLNGLHAQSCQKRPILHVETAGHRGCDRGLHPRFPGTRAVHQRHRPAHYGAPAASSTRSRTSASPPSTATSKTWGSSSRSCVLCSRSQRKKAAPPAKLSRLHGLHHTSTMKIAVSACLLLSLP